MKRRVRTEIPGRKILMVPRNGFPEEVLTAEGEAVTLPREEGREAREARVADEASNQ